MYKRISIDYRLYYIIDLGMGKIKIHPKDMRLP